MDDKIVADSVQLVLSAPRGIEVPSRLGIGQRDSNLVGQGKLGNLEVGFNVFLIDRCLPILEGC